jgi:hypothetical protein
MSDQFFYLQFKFIPKIGHTFTDEREVVVEIPKDLVQRKSESINEGQREVIALDFAKSAARHIPDRVGTGSRTLRRSSAKLVSRPTSSHERATL